MRGAANFTWPFSARQRPHQPRLRSRLGIASRDGARERSVAAVLRGARVLHPAGPIRQAGHRDVGRVMVPMSMDERIDDIRAVLDAAEVERASLLGFSEGGPWRRSSPRGIRNGSTNWCCMPVTAGRSRVSRLPVRLRGRADDPPNRGTRRDPLGHRGHAGALRTVVVAAPAGRPGQSRARPFREDGGHTECRCRAHGVPSRQRCQALMPDIQAPTLVVHRAGDRIVPLCNGEYLAAAIPDARLVVVDGDDHLPYVGDAAAIVAEVEQFLVGTTRHADRLRPAQVRPPTRSPCSPPRSCASPNASLRAWPTPRSPSPSTCHDTPWSPT